MILFAFGWSAKLKRDQTSVVWNELCWNEQIDERSDKHGSIQQTVADAAASDEWTCKRRNLARPSRPPCLNHIGRRSLPVKKCVMHCSSRSMVRRTERRASVAGTDE